MHFGGNSKLEAKLGVGVLLKRDKELNRIIYGNNFNILQRLFESYLAVFF